MRCAPFAHGCRGLTAATLVMTASPAFAQSSFAEHTRMNWDGVLTGIFFGLLIFSVAYNFTFFTLLRERFLLWQSGRSVIYLLLVIGLSPLAMGPYLSPDSFARQIYIHILFDLAVAVTGPFLRLYLEPGVIGHRTYRALGWVPLAVMATTPAMLVGDAPVYMALRNAILVGVLALSIFAVAQGWRNGSRTARYQALAWSGITSVYGISLFHDIVLGRPFEAFLFALFPALGLETILTALGMFDRLNHMRREREEARATANAMQVMAHSDPLTGLANRRGVEARFAERRPVAIAIVDLDHFKKVNDCHGHDVGDQVIAAAGQALAAGNAVVGRVGGEEFVMLLYGNLAAALNEAEVLRDAIATDVASAVPALATQVTASMGLALVEPDADFAAAMKAADVNLYAAKDGGRNRAFSRISVAA